VGVAVPYMPKMKEAIIAENTAFLNNFVIYHRSLTKLGRLAEVTVPYIAKPDMGDNSGNYEFS
jgi:hypothetical protein